MEYGIRYVCEWHGKQACSCELYMRATGEGTADLMGEGRGVSCSKIGTCTQF